MAAIPDPWSMTSVLCFKCTTPLHLQMIASAAGDVLKWISWWQWFQAYATGGLERRKAELPTCHLGHLVRNCLHEAVGMKPCDFPPGCKILNVFIKVHLKWLNDFSWFHELASGKGTVVQDRRVEQWYQCVFAAMAWAVSDHAEVVQEAEGKLCPWLVESKHLWLPNWHASLLGTCSLIRFLHFCKLY